MGRRLQTQVANKKISHAKQSGIDCNRRTYCFTCNILLLFEFDDLPTGERILASLFQSVTPRTAGFNTVNLTAISETGLYLMIILMLIGGSPGSTAGGMKTTTIAVLFSSAFSVFRKKTMRNL